MGETVFAGKEWFKYSPQSLPDDEIRLVVLPPRHKDDKPGLINCELVVAKLSDKPTYEALSYTWGPEEPAEGILIHDCVQSSRYLWIDALCINQDNVLERDHQVAQMGRIYEQARIVLVWLGPGDTTSSAAMRLLSKISEWWQTPESFDDSATWSLTYSAVAKEETPADWQAILNFCSREYWTRLWIIQEIVLAKDILLLCEEGSLPCVEFSKALLTLSYLRRGEEGPFPASQICQSLAARLDRERQSRLGTALRSNRLWDLFIAHQNSRCADARDKIFGLHGLTRECCRLGTPVNYMLSSRVVCGRLLHHHFDQHQLPETKMDFIHHLQKAQRILQCHSNSTDPASSQDLVDTSVSLEAQEPFEEQSSASVL